MTTGVDREVSLDVADVLVRYATGIDRRDWTAFRRCFTEDCEADYGDIGIWHGADEITTWMREVHDPCGHTMHRITNQVVEPHVGGVTARSYVDVILLGPDNQTGVQSAGYYDDELVMTAGGWKIARRRFTMVLLRSVEGGQPLGLEPKRE
ncbi:MAG: nuclear transport factor 2 family protein [Acidimicrobiales bacterium]